MLHALHNHCPATHTDCQKHFYPSVITSLRLLKFLKVQVNGSLSALPVQLAHYMVVKN